MTAYGVALRDTAGYVSDATNDTHYVSADTDYPVVRSTGGGKSLTFGCTALASLNLRDRNASLDAKIAGFGFEFMTGFTFKFDWPDGPGTYDVKFALGDPSGADDAEAKLTVKDDSTTLFTINVTPGATSAHMMDATGTIYTVAAWPASNTAHSVTASGTSCVLQFTSTADYNMLSYVSLNRTGGGASTGGGMIHHLRNLGAY